MLARAVRHIRSNLVAYLALSVALGGTSYAAVTNITSAQIKNNSVQGKDIKDGSIKSADVGNRSLLAKDFKKGQLPAGARGPVGPQGLIGPRGPVGPRGPSGATDTSAVYTKTQNDAKYLGKGEKAADAESVDGLDGASLLHGPVSIGETAVLAVLANSSSETSALCGPGEKVTGGGVDWTETPTAATQILESRPDADLGGWHVIVGNTSGQNHSYQVK